MSHSNNIGIYYIKNKINGMMYIGQSIDIHRRKQTHLSHLRSNSHVNTYLQNSFNYYGESSFEFGVLKFCDKTELDDLEVKFMQEYDTKNKGYNICDGGIQVCPDNSNENHGMWREDISNIRLKELYLQDYNSKQLALKFNCSPRTINRRLKKIFGEKYDTLKRQKQLRAIKKSSRKNAKFSDDEILKLAKTGYNSVEIANQVGCSDSTVMNRLKNLFSKEEFEEYKRNNTHNKLNVMRSKLTKKSYKKMADGHKKYDLWDGSKVHYAKKKSNYPCACFYFRYNAHDLPIGGFIEFISLEIIHKLINEF